MAIQYVRSVVIVCDGCDTPLEAGRIFPFPEDARGYAYGVGWRFPPMLTKSGTPSKRHAVVCPTCLPSWQPVRETR